MADAWYYQRGDQRVGPVSSQELKRLACAGELQPTDWLWKEGMAHPIAASHAKELFPQAVPQEATSAPREASRAGVKPTMPSRKDSTPIPLSSGTPIIVFRRPWFLCSLICLASFLTIKNFGVLFLSLSFLKSFEATETASGLFIFLAVLLSLYTALDKYVLHKGCEVRPSPRVKLLATVLGCAAASSFVLPMAPAIRAATRAGQLASPNVMTSVRWRNSDCLPAGLGGRSKHKTVG